MPHGLSSDVITDLARLHEKDTPQEIIKEAAKRIANLTFACSFGAEDMVIVDMIAKLNLKIPVFYLDTNLLFGETYALRDLAQDTYRNVRFVQVLPALTLVDQAQQYGHELCKVRPDQCCALRKVQPLEKHLQGFDGWITGIRRDQSPTRANAQTFEVDTRFHLTKINPLILFTQEDVWTYVQENNVPYNPLHDHGYPSIGCAPCTNPVAQGEDPRSGRWAGFAKTECGLHQNTSAS